MPTADELLKGVDYAAHAKRLGAVLAKYYIELVEVAWNEERTRLAVLGTFDLKNPHVQDAIKKLTGKRIVAMANTTKNDLRDLLERIFAQEKVPGIETIAKQIREAGIETSRWRSQMLARSETAVGYNMGALASYREAGIDKVEVLDSDEDDLCASVNGTTQTLEWAEENPIGHPNCVRAFSAVLPD